MSDARSVSGTGQNPPVRSPLELAQRFPAESLPAFLRVLLTTDGTVTQSLEAFFWEPIEVVCCGQHTSSLGVDEPLLEKRAGEEVLKRHVQLVGRQSGVIYAHADSSLDVSGLPAFLREGMASGRLGIGELLRESGVETYREIIDFGELDQGSELGFEGRIVWRRYRIKMAGRTLILIRESFPISVYS